MRLWLLLPLLLSAVPLSSQLSQVDFLARARHFLLSANTSQILSTPRRLVVSEEVPIQTPLSRLVTRLEIPLDRNLTALEVIALKPIAGFKDANNFTHIGVLLGYSDGVIELREASGGLLYRHDTGTKEAITLLATTGAADDLRFALVTSARFQSIRVDMFALKKGATVNTGEWGSQTVRAALGLIVEGEEVLEQHIGAMAYYGKGSSKYWLLGDRAGGINIYSANGTFVKRNDLGKGPIVALERSGALMYFAAGSTIGLWQPNQSPSSLCEEHSVPITHLLSDQALLFAAYENGDILGFDTKYAVGNEHVCKAVWRIAGHEKPVKLAGSKGALLVWTERHSLLVHTNIFQNLQSGAVDISESEGQFKAMRYQNGYLLLVSSGEKMLRVLEVLPPYRPASPGWDSSSYKGLLFVGALGVVALLQLCKKPGAKLMRKPKRRY